MTVKPRNRTLAVKADAGKAVRAHVETAVRNRLAADVIGRTAGCFALSEGGLSGGTAIYAATI